MGVVIALLLRAACLSTYFHQTSPHAAQTTSLSPKACISSTQPQSRASPAGRPPALAQIFRCGPPANLRPGEPPESPVLQESRPACQNLSGFLSAVGTIHTPYETRQSIRRDY